MSKQPVLLQARYRSGLEEKLAAQMEEEGIRFHYEPRKIPYLVPERKANYLLDFEVDEVGSGIILEGKGRFTSHTTRCPRCKHCFPVGNGAEARQKMVLVKEQHPELDIRFVFQRASTPIYPKSPTSYGKWCDDHGFPWSDKGKLPADWIKEFKKT